MFNSSRRLHLYFNHVVFIITMPGIAGFLSDSKAQHAGSIVEAMVNAMLHEPSYRSGMVGGDPSWGSAGWVAHAQSFADCMPVWNETHDICLLFAGENFAGQSELENLRARGHEFDPDTASYLVHLYEEAGAGFFERLNGIFSGLLIDQRENRVMLFNDRYGLKRIYYHESPAGFYFASEAKALMRVLPQLRQLDMRGLGEYFACGCVLQDRTLFSGVSLLPVGSVCTFEPGRPVRKEQYFDPRSWENLPALPEEEYYSRLRETFARILPRYFRSRQKIAMSLTGGLDSRMIMAWAKQAPNSLQCYSHRGMVRECADSRIARQVATICRQPHRTVTVDGDFLDQFPSLAEHAVYVTDGCMDVTGAVGLYVNRAARTEMAPVRMTGNYGGEILRGVAMLGPTKLRNPFLAGDFESWIVEGQATLASERLSQKTSFVVFKQVPWYHQSRFALESSQLTVRSPYLDNALVALGFQAPADVGVNQRLAARLIAEGNDRLAAFPTDRGPLGRGGFLGGLAQRYQEFTFKADYAYDYGMPHWLTRADNLVRPLHLERLFLGRHKYYHFRYFYRNRLAPFVKDVLLDSRALSRSYLDRRRVERIVRDHTSGRGNYTSEIHLLLTVELLQRRLVEVK